MDTEQLENIGSVDIASSILVTFMCGNLALTCHLIGCFMIILAICVVLVNDFLITSNGLYPK